VINSRIVITFCHLDIHLDGNFLSVNNKKIGKVSILP